jgi:hypothetical protein
MKTILRFPFFIPTAVTLGVLLSITCAIAQPTRLHRRFTPPPPPPDRSAPGNRGEGASRGCVSGDQPLTALVPVYQQADVVQVWGLTSQAQPGFWFYLPYEPNVIQSIEFVVQDDQEETLYRSAIPIPDRSGPMQVKLPATTSLAAGKAYHWFFKVKTLCPNQPAPTSTYVEGWVKRQALPTAVSDRLRNATPQEQSAIYAENGLWYDALNAIGEGIMTTPGNTALAEEWKGLLEEIGLGNLVE